jgi:hypothetical protein
MPPARGQGSAHLVRQGLLRSLSQAHAANRERRGALFIAPHIRGSRYGDSAPNVDPWGPFAWRTVAGPSVLTVPLRWRVTSPVSFHSPIRQPISHRIGAQSWPRCAPWSSEAPLFWPGGRPIRAGDGGAARPVRHRRVMSGTDALGLGLALLALGIGPDTRLSRFRTPRAQRSANPDGRCDSGHIQPRSGVD